jgi:hypothetical protein
MQRLALTFAVALFSGWSPNGQEARAQCVGHEDHKLLDPEGATRDALGGAVALAGDFSLVAAAWDDEQAQDSGSVQVFREQQGQVLREDKLIPSDAARWQLFGWSIAADGDVLLVGTPGDAEEGYRAGAGYIFRLSGDQWVEEAKLLGSAVSPFDEMGLSVAIHGDLALLGAPGDDWNGTSTGAVYAFRFDGSQWQEEQRITAIDGAAYDEFGDAIAVWGDVALIGARNDDDGGANSGSAYVFRFDGTAWNQEQKLVADDAEIGDALGSAVAIHGAVALVGVPLSDDAGTWSGSAYVFRRIGDLWSQEQKLTAFDAGSWDQYGAAVSLQEDVALVGAWGDEGGDSGSAYAYRYTGSEWVDLQKFKASNPLYYAEAGRSIALKGNRALLGAPGDPQTGHTAGAAYLYRIPDYALDITPDVVQSGASLTIATCGALPGSPTLLFLVAVNEIPLFNRVATATLNTTGGWNITTTAPDLANTSLTLQAFSFGMDGSVVQSNSKTLLFP